MGLNKDGGITSITQDAQRGFTELSMRGPKEVKDGDKTFGVNRDEQCYSPYQGHIRGPVDFPYTELLCNG